MFEILIRQPSEHVQKAKPFVNLELRRKIFKQKVTVIKINEISQEMCGLRSKENQEMTQKALFYAE